MLKRVSLLILGILLSSNTYAMTDAELAAEEQKYLQQIDQIAEEKRQLLKQMEEIEKVRKAGISLPAPEIKKEIVPVKETIYVKEIIVEGVSVFSVRKIRSIVSKYSNRELSKIDIGNIQTKLQNLYMNKGYTAARVYIDINTLPQGILKFVVLEGVIEKIRFSDKQDPLPIFMAFPFLEGNVFNIRNIEQGLEQMNKIKSNDVVMNIVPGEKEGETIVELKNKPSRRTRLNIGVDNAGSETTKEYRNTTGLEIDNFFRLNDNLTLNYVRGLNDKEDEFYSNTYSAIMSIPFGYWTFSANYSKSFYLTTVPGLFGNIQSKADSYTQGLSVDKMLFRGQRYRFSSGVKISRKEVNSFLIQGIISQKLPSSMQIAPAELYIMDTHYLENGSLMIRLNYIRGLDAFGAQKDPQDIKIGDPKAQYEALGALGYFYSIFNVPGVNFPLTYMANFRAQYSWYDLLGSEQFGTSVRGFKDGGVSGESGFSISNDITTPLENCFSFFDDKNVTKALKYFSIGVFYDVGMIRPNTYGSVQTMSSWGPTISGNYLKYINFNLSLANIIAVPDYFYGEKSSVSFSVNTNIPLF
ncbi:MAG: ShlB/FhaC/HecB family hemolysin secretion/activation protein [Elusimicrobia bacterium]|nr:ShlB/FhaC/HecB family hemolysin secretion/activation protein [Elusimicrobiota bacterium]